MLTRNVNGECYESTMKQPRRLRSSKIARLLMMASRGKVEQMSMATSATAPLLNDKLFRLRRPSTQLFSMAGPTSKPKKGDYLSIPCVFLSDYSVNCSTPRYSLQSPESVSYTVQCHFCTGLGIRIGAHSGPHLQSGWKFRRARSEKNRHFCTITFLLVMDLIKGLQVRVA